jgi:hypothetical protein
MEQLLHIHIEKLPEGVYLATSNEVPGLVAQGRTVTETLEIARAERLLAGQLEPDRDDCLQAATIRQSRYYDARLQLR